jgi:hypothetical protein
MQLLALRTLGSRLPIQVISCGLHTTWSSKKHSLDMTDAKSLQALCASVHSILTSTPQEVPN